MNRSLELLALALMDIGAVKIAGPGEPGFTLKAHEKNPDLPRSPIFFNLRTPDNEKSGPLTPEIVAAIGREMWLKVGGSIGELEFICGVPNAGDPLADALKAAIHGWKFGPEVIRLRKEGTVGNRRVVGLANPVTRVGTALLVDDLVTGADSKLEAVHGLAEAGIPVRDCIIVIDREQGGRAELLMNNIRLHSLYTITELLDLYRNADRISGETRDRVMTYIAANQVGSSA